MHMPAQIECGSTNTMHQQTLGALPDSTVVLIDGIVIHSTTIDSVAIHSTYSKQL